MKTREEVAREYLLEKFPVYKNEADSACLDLDIQIHKEGQLAGEKRIIDLIKSGECAAFVYHEDSFEELLRHIIK